ncbi:MAG: hypothetical protein AAF533_19310 [Acidobacteriota bacterium]
MRLVTRWSWIACLAWLTILPVRAQAMPCCLPDASCAELEPEDCLAFTGRTVPGESCATTDCSPLQACCLAPLSCLDLTPAACRAMGGVSAGEGSRCELEECAVGACCRPDGSCEELDFRACNSVGEVTLATTCEARACEITGACCASLGAGDCEQLSELDCLASGGSYLGDETLCQTSDCTAPGACCLADGTCLQLTSIECSGARGRWWGAGIGCELAGCQPLRACCVVIGIALCLDLEPRACAEVDGFSLDATCSEVDCSRSACCLPDGSCSDLGRSECRASGGQVQPMGTTCATTSCAVEACCFHQDGATTCEDTTAATCTVSAGLPQGPGTSCATADCDTAWGRVCCLPDQSCALSTPTDCIALGGTPLDEDDCATAACERGACCFPVFGGCESLDWWGCFTSDGVFAGAGTECSTIDCEFALPGVVPNGTSDRPGAPLRVRRGTDDEVALDWSPSCSPTVTGYSVHEGAIGLWYSHDVVACANDDLSLTASLVPAAGARYFLVVPVTHEREGSAGVDSLGRERPRSGETCVEHLRLGCR